MTPRIFKKGQRVPGYVMRCRPWVIWKLVFGCDVCVFREDGAVIIEPRAEPFDCVIYGRPRWPFSRLNLEYKVHLIGAPTSIDHSGPFLVANGAEASETPKTFGTHGHYSRKTGTLKWD